MNLTFRKATEEDADLIYKLAEKIWREHYYPDILSNEQIDYMLRTRYSPELLAEKMRHGEQFYLGYGEDRAIAYGSVEPVDGVYFLHKFYIDVAKQRSGVGSRFFEYLLLQTDSRKPVKLQVNRQNYKAINFYFKNGFTIESVQDFDIGDGYYMNDFIMARKPEKAE